MEVITRKPFQGVTNIVRFNRHFYFLFLAVVGILALLTQFVPSPMKLVISMGILLMVLGMLLSLAVSYYIYDCSKLYKLDWLHKVEIPETAEIANINAGFDETSILLAHKFDAAHIAAYDFYDPAKHTEIAITRARKAYAPWPRTIAINTSDVPFKPGSFDVIFAILTVHEIRDTTERIKFFSALRLALKPGGKIIVLEHQRNFANFVAYNIGFFHFFSKKEWKKTFSSSGLSVTNEFSITPFVSTFILQ